MKKIIDEICECGHKKSEHDYSQKKHSAILKVGHGPCERCNCKRFRWIAFIYENWE